MRSGPKNSASLFVIRGHDQGKRFVLDQDLMNVGRDPSNVIQLHDTEVSRRHAELRRSGRGYVLSDLGSSNGTFVNGQRANSHRLDSGDRVQIGSTLMLYTEPGDDSAADLAGRVNIIGPEHYGDESRIVHSMSHVEGSALLRGEDHSQHSPWLARARSNLQVMYRTALAVSHTLEIDQLLDRILQLIFEWVECDRGCVLLIDPETKQVQPAVSRTRQGADSTEKLIISRTILDYVLEHNEGVLTSDAREDQRWNPTGSIVRLGVREAICVPMQGRYDTVGVIYIDTSTPPEDIVRQGPAPKFTEEHLKLMIAIAHQAALAVEDTRYYSAMVQAERLAAVGQTVATLSHHIKNILQGIRGGSYLIEEGLKQHDEQMVRKGWSFVEKNQEKISHLVLDMLTFSKEREPDLVAGDLNQVTADVVELAAGHAAESGVKVHFSPGAGMPALHFDPEGIHRAILNVVSNAIDACEGRDDGEVRVWTMFDPEHQRACVCVEDNGTGIPEDEIQHIFTAFHSTKGARGTGLGLPVSQKILREHGGRITVQSWPLRGSRFTMELPANLGQCGGDSGTLDGATLSGDGSTGS